jgi:hypothetical protein
MMGTEAHDTPELHAGGDARARARSLLALDARELEAFVQQHGGRTFHARIVRANVLAKNLLDYEAMSS